MRTETTEQLLRDALTGLCEAVRGDLPNDLDKIAEHWGGFVADRYEQAQVALTAKKDMLS